jgi:cell division protein FtsA
MLRKISVGIDIGTFQIKVVVSEEVKMENDFYSPKIIATGFAESKGMRHGYIINSDDVTRCIKIAIEQAEKNAKIKIKKAYISIGGIGLGSIIGKGAVMISKADSEITEIDVRSVLSIAECDLPQSAMMNKKIINQVPISYKIDGQPLIGRPIGMHGARLETKVLFVYCLEQHLNDLIKAVGDAGIDVVDVMASPLAGSIVALSKTQKIAGCVLANIGSETVSISVFENNIPISLEVLPIGGTDITNDIALGLRIPIDEAEHIKIGSVKSEMYPKKKLDEIIMARLSDIFDLIEAHLKKIGRSGLLPAGVILTGGSSGIETIEDIARATLKLPSKIASLSLSSNIKNSELKDSTWAVAYGLSIWGLNSGDDMSGIKVPSKGVWDWFKKMFRPFLP